MPIPKQPLGPIPGHLSVRAARDLYLSYNGFSMAEYTAPTFSFLWLGRTVTLPNPPARQVVIAFHDLHHVLIGYHTDFAGEGEISAWELRCGCNTFFLWFINILGLLLGLAVAPRRTWRALRSARGTTLYRDGISYEAALDMRLVDLRRRLGLPDDGIASTQAPATAATHIAHA
jgi:hypothetical protein